MTRSIARDIRIDASPEVVYEVVSTPEHLRGWWPDDADLTAVPGAAGTITFGTDKVEALTVVDADPPRKFSFRWSYGVGNVPATGNSVLATFELIPDGDGTLLRFSETGFDEIPTGDELFESHTTGWNHFLPRLAPYAEKVA
ncbi:polyketide cyclase [Kribbella antibiotica]|uniref:Polyketide cyclase n=1 Tax=Kribbella antibiotica TaxID=190195 RepID=A0A4R4ZMS5_9ACTN|nr:SRPBCC domain-containing protein [Kribbella antibiotica]TDD59895.1 polyketide cyclase [Kribbella antibiotica]